MKPELWSDEDIDTFATTVYEECKGKDCDKCPRRLEVNGETCMVDVIGDLWRKWKNTRAEVEAAVADLSRSEDCGTCKNNRMLSVCKKCIKLTDDWENPIYYKTLWGWRGVNND